MTTPNPFTRRIDLPHRDAIVLTFDCHKAEYLEAVGNAIAAEVGFTHGTLTGDCLLETYFAADDLGYIVIDRAAARTEELVRHIHTPIFYTDA